MTVLPLTNLGHPTLRRRAEEILDTADPGWGTLATDMIETMEAAGGVGLAGPQVDMPYRIIVFTVPAERQEVDEPKPPPGTQVLLNPEWFPVDEDGNPLDPDFLPDEDDEEVWLDDVDSSLQSMDLLEEGLEGCLSIPGLRGLVPRFRRILYRGTDLNGRHIERVAEGFHARVVQHEIDHLDGILFIDRMIDLRTLCFESELHYLLEGRLDTDDEDDD